MDRELPSFLVQFSIALHKSAAYPPGHPLAKGAVEAALGGLNAVLAREPALALGIARTQLLIDSEPVEPGHPVIRELAHRLHRRRLGGVTFAEGVTADEFSGLLAFVNARRTEESAASLEVELPQWPHIRLLPPAFDQLRLAGDGAGAAAEGDDQVGTIWADLARSAFQGKPGADGEASLDPTAVAQAINRQGLDRASARTLVAHLVRLSDAVRAGGGAEGHVVSRQLTELLAGLRPERLHELLELGPDAAQRHQLVADLSRSMPMGAVIELMRASAGATQQTISHALLRILSKLAAHADGPGARYGAPVDDQALRQMVLELLEGWELKDPNPQSYTAMLQGLSRPTGGPARPARALPAHEPDAAEACRVVWTALEVGVWGEAVRGALETMIEKGELAALLETLRSAPGGDITAEQVWAHVATPDRLRHLLAVDEPDPTLVEPLLARLDLAAAEPMLDALATSESRAARRRLLSWLSRLGPDIGPPALARLDSPQWYVQRNMLLLLGAADPPPPGFTPMPYLAHADARVRREALRIALRRPSLRDGAIARGLADPDEQNLRIAVAAALDGCPAVAVPLVARRLEQPTLGPELRLLLIRVLAAASTPGARDWLVQRCIVRRRLLPGKRLAPKSPELLAALAALAARWAADAGAAEVLRVAGASPDGELRAAASGTGS
ncbi:MAG TPA: hypothetical protein VFU46_08420 [Gemmatimonadales bacterium]|nr:hypothetical protein [Gemmatimonadales bacterium]